MNVKLRVLGIGALFFIGSQVVYGQKVGDTLATQEIDEVIVVGYSKVKKES